MESKFTCSVSVREMVTRDQIVNLSSLLHALAARECNCSESNLGGGITLYCGPDILRFDASEELSAHIPPLAQIDGFRMAVFFNPMHLHHDAPTVSLFAGKVSGNSSVSIIATAATPARAQELGLEIRSALLELYPSAQQGSEQHIGKKPQKQPKKTLVSRLESFNTVADAASNVSSGASAILRLIRFLAKMFSCF